MAILALIFRAVGLVQWAIQLEAIIAAKVKAQRIADTPTTKKELTDAANKGDL